MTETATQTTITTLASRGIEKVARAAGWEDRENHWRYPVYTLYGVSNSQPAFYRHKAYDSSAKPKYWGEKPKDREGVDYYNPRDLQERIKRANGELFIAAGEIDLLTLIAAGHDNCLSWFGEGNIPSTLVRNLQELAVSKVIYIPDLDGPGLNAAAKLDAIMQHSGIPVTYWALTGGEWGTGWDLNNEWQDCIFDPKALDARMDNICATFAHYCAWYKRPMPTIGTDPKAADSPQPSTPAPQLPQSLIDAITDALGVTGWEVKPSGFTRKMIPCPAVKHEHDDKTPATAWNMKDNFLKCQKCGTSWNAVETARLLGIDPAPFFDAAKSNGTDKTQLHIAPANAPTQPLPAPVAKSHISTAFDAAEKVKTALDSGNGLYVFPFPLVTFRKQGGAPFVVSGKIVGVAGDSGTGKTTFLATIIDGLLAQGVYVYHDSPEWSPEELYILDIQAESGGRLTYHRIEGHINALQSEALGLAIPEDVPGRLSGDELALFDALSAQILERNLRPERGQVRYVDTSLSLEHKLQVIQASITEDRANGLQRHAVVFDYLQALKMEHEPKKGKNYEQEKLTTIKSWCDPAAANVAVFLATQVVKEQSTRMRETGRRMGADAMHSINRNEFNYLLNMNIVYQKSEDGTLLTEKGEKQGVTCNIGTYEKPVDVPLMLAEVQKNNRGPEGALIPMLLNWQTARFEAVDVAGDGLPLAGSRRGL